MASDDQIELWAQASATSLCSSCTSSSMRERISPAGEGISGGASKMAAGPAVALHEWGRRIEFVRDDPDMAGACDFVLELVQFALGAFRQRCEFIEVTVRDVFIAAMGAFALVPLLQRKDGVAMSFGEGAAKKRQTYARSGSVGAGHYRWARLFTRRAEADAEAGARE